MGDATPQAGCNDDLSSSPTTADSSSRSAPTSDMNASDGRYKLNHSLRSILMSRTTYRLFCGFNNDGSHDGDTSENGNDDDDAGSTTTNNGRGDDGQGGPKHDDSPHDAANAPSFDDAVNAIASYPTCGDSQNPPTSKTENGSSTRKIMWSDQHGELPNFRKGLTNQETGLFESTVEEVKAVKQGKVSEPPITKLLSEKIGELPLLRSQNERPVPLYEDVTSHPAIDIAIDEESGGENAGMVGVVEAGITKPREGPKALDKLFWSKIGQLLRYLRLLWEDIDSDTKGATAAKKHFRADGPLLVCVVVTDREVGKGRIAVFHAIPIIGRALKTNEIPYRVAMLWRRELGTTLELSKAFAYFISALKYLAKNGQTLKTQESGWKCLGPNCVKVSINDASDDRCNPGQQSFVLRAYDNRVQQTPRSPFLYKNWGPLSKDTRVLLQVQDQVVSGGTIMGFRDTDCYFELNLFDEYGDGGQVEVIAVPYVLGKHYCESIGEARSLIQSMKQLHDDDYVHGDIRALNLLFCGEKTSQLIDFDFGGKSGEVTYPPHYRTKLLDGHRRGWAGCQITKADDISALVQIFKSFHDCSKETNWPNFLDWWNGVGKVEEEEQGLQKMLTMLSTESGTVRVNREYAWLKDVPHNSNIPQTLRTHGDKGDAKGISPATEAPSPQDRKRGPRLQLRGAAKKQKPGSSDQPQQQE